MKTSALEIIDCPLPAKIAPGDLPKLDWLDISSLRVDESYQRPVMKRGRENIARIVADFHWNRFSPVIVMPVAGGFYAIIDGQHRAIAAQRLGLKQIPCQIVTAAPKEAARIFAIINGNVTPMTPQYLFKAARASGDEWALIVDRICKKADVEILTYPVQISRQKPRQTMMIGTLRHRVSRYGEDIVGLALEGMMKSPRADVPGFARSLGLDAAISAVHATAGALQDRPGTIEALARIDYASLTRATIRLPKLGEARWRPRYMSKPQPSPARPLTLIRQSQREQIVDLHKRRFPLNAIATTLRIPYAEVQRVIDGVQP